MVSEDLKISFSGGKTLFKRAPHTHDRNTQSENLINVIAEISGNLNNYQVSSGWINFFILFLQPPERREFPYDYRYCYRSDALLN